MNYERWVKTQPGPMPSADVIEDDPEYRPPCCHPQHEPPHHIVIRPGQRLRHRCPGCGKEVVLRGNHTVM
jgi:hypothetical protein